LRSLGKRRIAVVSAAVAALAIIGGGVWLSQRNLRFTQEPAQRQPLPEKADKNSKPPTQVLFTKVDVFDGFNPNLIENANVLIEGNVITRVSTTPIDAPDAFVVDAAGKTMTPGLIDMHSHIVFMTPEGTNSYSDEWDGPGGGAMAAQAVRDDYLMKGITTIRDIAGNSRGIARAAQRGLLISPRIYTSGSVLSQTGGHGDWGARNDTHVVDHGAAIQHSMIVDGREDVIRATRRNYRNGAHFTKIMAGGGVASRFDPIEILSANKEEVEAAVEIAENYGTYVAIHAYHDRSYQQALDAGVRSFEHGFLISEPIVKQMASKGEKVVWSFQCYVSINTFGSYESMPDFFTHEQKLKGVAVGKGARNAAKMMKKHGVFTVGGSDMFGPGLQERIKEDITCNVDAGYTPAEALKHWTGNAGKVLKWSGPLDPYPTYALGRIAPDTYADILIWDKNPLEDINVILDENNLKFVMKDGIAYKNTLVEADSLMYRPAKQPITRAQIPL
jgi:imidazolonepropionase-like amidohydrolase